jgi:hypothetical protein
LPGHAIRHPGRDRQLRPPDFPILKQLFWRVVRKGFNPQKQE